MIILSKLYYFRKNGKQKSNILMTIIPLEQSTSLIDVTQIQNTATTTTILGTTSTILTIISYVIIIKIAVTSILTEHGD